MYGLPPAGPFAGPKAFAEATHSRPRFEHQVERRLGGAAEAGEPALRHHIAQARLARLRAQAGADFLRARAGVQMKVEAE